MSRKNDITWVNSVLDKKSRPPQYKRQNPILIGKDGSDHYLYIFNNGYAVDIRWKINKGLNTNPDVYPYILVKVLDMDNMRYVLIRSSNIPFNLARSTVNVQTKGGLFKILDMVSSLPSDIRLGKSKVKMLRKYLEYDKRLDSVPNLIDDIISNHPLGVVPQDTLNIINGEYSRATETRMFSGYYTNDVLSGIQSLGQAMAEGVKVDMTDVSLFFSRMSDAIRREVNGR